MQNKVPPCHLQQGKQPFLYGLVRPSIKCEKVNQYISMPLQIGEVAFSRNINWRNLYSNTKSFSVCRLLWWKLVLKKLFVEHVIIPTEPAAGRDGVKKRKPFKLSFFIKVCTVMMNVGYLQIVFIEFIWFYSSLSCYSISNFLDSSLLVIL